MAYKFTIGSALIRQVGDETTGLTIVINCENLDTGAISELTWFAETTDFPQWLPTKAQAKTYIKSYLLEKPLGRDLTRLADMKARAVLIADTPIETFNGEIIEES